MKLLLLYYLFQLIALHTCSVNNTNTLVPENTIEIQKDTIDFINQVQPILVKKCSPCHFTGGKMYEKMPFDQAETIITHDEGILKRFKNEENMLIKNFIAQNKNGPSSDRPH